MMLQKDKDTKGLIEDKLLDRNIQRRVIHVLNLASVILFLVHVAYPEYLE